jgi:RNA polymerase sigma-70 factor, ECF subfamily
MTTTLHRYARDGAFAVPVPMRDVAPAATAVATTGRLEAMFDMHYDSVWRTLRRLGVADAIVDDAAQRVFMVASRRLDTIVVGHEGRFLYGVALRVASETRRRDPSRREIADDEAVSAVADERPGPEEQLLDGEARAALDAALAGLDDELREALVLVELEGITVPELAEILGVPVGTAASRLRRAREAFTKSARRVRARLETGIGGGT